MTPPHNAPERMKPPVPGEHGAWAVLLGACVTGLVAAGTWNTLVVLLFAISMLSLFLAHEPLVKLIRTRRQGVRASLRRHWTVWLVAYALAGSISGLILVIVFKLWLLAAIGAVNGGVFLLHTRLAASRRDRSASAEILGIAALSSVSSAAYYSQTERFDTAAVLLWVMNLLFFAGGVFYVKMRVSWFLKKARFAYNRRVCLLYSFGVLTVVAGAVLLGVVATAAIVGFALAAGRTLWFALRPGETLNLRRIGYMEVALSICFVAALSFGWMDLSGV